jgi:hypothetical protein
MSVRRLGCISVAGLLAVLVTLLLTTGFILLGGGSIFSPGPLNAQAGEEALRGVHSHAETGGRCEACHTAPWSSDTLADRCLDCHTSVAAELTDASTLHGALEVERSARGCRLCHTEHRGPTTALTKVDPATFPHAVTGYVLTGHRTQGAGQPFTCADCHPASLARFDATTCDTCHRQADATYMQAHTSAFGAECLVCHDGGDRYSRRTFDHGRAFPLTGKHTRAACAACHVGARSPADLKATPQTCVGCHAKDDQHKGAFGTACGACHKTDAWQGATFDHGKSAFPLTGKHIQVDCARCHINNVYKATPQTCVGCHAKDDQHKGAFGTACGACHKTDAWQGATFDHSQSAFPLTGKHVQAGCARCHINNVYKGTPQTCVGCHQDPAYHLGVFGTACADCHTANGWHPAQYNRPHTFPFNHGESGVGSCKTCHSTQVKVYMCYGCHEHTEAGIAAKHRKEGIANFTDCMKCHPTGREEEGKGGRND